jgi:hypothetical protein
MLALAFMLSGAPGARVWASGIVPGPIVADTSVQEITFCLGVLEDGDPWNFVDYCTELLKLPEFCAKYDAYPAQEGGTGKVFCAGYYHEPTFWEEFKAVSLGTLAEVSVAVAYGQAVAEVYSCLDGNFISCPVAAQKISDLAGVEFPAAEALKFSSDVSKCYEGDPQACINASDTVGVPYSKAVAAAYDKQKNKIKAMIAVVDCYQGETEECVTAAQAVLDETNVKLPVGEAVQLANNLQACADGDVQACIDAANYLGLSPDKLVGAAGLTKLANDLKGSGTSMEHCMIEGDLDQCAFAATQGNLLSELPGGSQAQVVVDILACYQYDIAACERAAQIMGIDPGPVVAAAPKGAAGLQDIANLIKNGSSSVKHCLIDHDFSQCDDAANGEARDLLKNLLGSLRIGDIETGLRNCPTKPQSCEDAAELLGLDLASSGNGQSTASANTNVTAGGNINPVALSGANNLPGQGLPSLASNDNNDGDETVTETKSAKIPTATPTPTRTPAPTATPTQTPGASRQSATSGAAPEGFISRPSYTGDCTQRPAGTVCVTFSDHYVYLWNQPVVSRSTADLPDGRDVEIVIGSTNKLAHVLGTTFIAISPK